MAYMESKSLPKNKKKNKIIENGNTPKNEWNKLYSNIRISIKKNGKFTKIIL